jgi:hypothetical protein
MWQLILESLERLRWLKLPNICGQTCQCLILYKFGTDSTIIHPRLYITIHSDQFQLLDHSLFAGTVSQEQYWPHHGCIG